MKIIAKNKKDKRAAEIAEIILAPKYKEAKPYIDKIFECVEVLELIFGIKINVDIEE